MSKNCVDGLPNPPLIEEMHEDVNKTAIDDVVFTIMPGRDVQDKSERKRDVTSATMERDGLISSEEAYEKVKRYCELNTMLGKTATDVVQHCDLLQNAAEKLQNEFAMRQARIEQLCIL